MRTMTVVPPDHRARPPDERRWPTTPPRGNGSPDPVLMRQCLAQLERVLGRFWTEELVAQEDPSTREVLCTFCGNVTSLRRLIASTPGGGARGLQVVTGPGAARKAQEWS